MNEETKLTTLEETSPEVKSEVLQGEVVEAPSESDKKGPDIEAGYSRDNSIEVGDGATIKINNHQDISKTTIKGSRFMADAQANEVNTQQPAQENDYQIGG